MIDLSDVEKRIKDGYIKKDRQGLFNAFVKIFDNEDKEVWGVGKTPEEAIQNAYDRISDYLKWKEGEDNGKKNNSDN